VDREVSEGASGGESHEQFTKREAIAQEIVDAIFQPPKNTIVEPEHVFISVSKELHDHYQVIIETRDRILEDHDESASGKASILNATTSILKDLAKTQQELYNSDTVARLQQAVYNTLKEVDPALKDKVLSLLEKNLETL